MRHPHSFCDMYSESLQDMSGYNMDTCYPQFSSLSCVHCSMQRGRNAFLLSAMEGHLPVAEYLAPKMGGHLFDSDDDGNTALHLAAYFGHLPMVRYLVRSCGFDVKAVNKVGFHCLLLV